MLTREEFYKNKKIGYAFMDEFIDYEDYVKKQNEIDRPTFKKLLIKCLLYALLGLIFGSVGYLLIQLSFYLFVVIGLVVLVLTFRI